MICYCTDSNAYPVLLKSVLCTRKCHANNITEIKPGLLTNRGEESIDLKVREKILFHTAVRTARVL